MKDHMLWTMMQEKEKPEQNLMEAALPGIRTRNHPVGGDGAAAQLAAGRIQTRQGCSSATGPAFVDGSSQP